MEKRETCAKGQKLEARGLHPIGKGPDFPPNRGLCKDLDLSYLKTLKVGVMCYFISNFKFQIFVE